jgi:hypothetical protein
VCGAQGVVRQQGYCRGCTAAATRKVAVSGTFQMPIRSGRRAAWCFGQLVVDGRRFGQLCFGRVVFRSAGVGASFRSAGRWAGGQSRAGSVVAWLGGGVLPPRRGEGSLSGPGWDGEVVLVVGSPTSCVAATWWWRLRAAVPGHALHRLGRAAPAGRLHGRSRGLGEHPALLRPLPGRFACPAAPACGALAAAMAHAVAGERPGWAGSRAKTLQIG